MGHYGDKFFHVQNNILSFSNPSTPYSWQPTTKTQTGYFCVFTEDFITPALKTESLGQSSLFKTGGNHLFSPDKNTMIFLDAIFSRMLAEVNTNYTHKYEILRSYVQIILHEAIKMEPVDPIYQQGNAGTRISSQFLGLLEGQFPIDSTKHSLRLKTANEFAAHLSLHTGHLNRVLKETTGKTTTELIASRVSKEAKVLLQYSNWSIAEIAYCLGFDYPSNFNIFFKRQTQLTPSQYRRQVIFLS